MLVTSGNLTLYESRPISKYLAKKYAIPLLPADTDLEAVALFDQAQSIETLYFAEPAGKISFEKFLKPILGLPVNEAAVTEAMRSLETFCDVTERHLNQHSYMAGDEFSLVDIYYIPLVQRLFVCGYGEVITGRKALGAWWERCINRPAIKEMLAADKAAAPAAFSKKS